MWTKALIFSLLIASTILTGCVVAPAPPRRRVLVVHPPPVVVVRPHRRWR
jgi:hypothetical protein